MGIIFLYVKEWMKLGIDKDINKDNINKSIDKDMEKRKEIALNNIENGYY